MAKPDRNAQVYTSSKYEQTHDFVGIVTGYDAEKKRAYFEQRNNVKAGEPLELLMPDGSTMPFVLTEMLDEAGTPIDCAPHAQQKFSAASAAAAIQLITQKGCKRMSDNDPGPHSMIYAQVEPERIADVNWIMEGYEQLAMVSTVDGTSGLIKFYATPDTYFDTLDIIENMPFKVDVIDNMENGVYHRLWQI